MGWFRQRVSAWSCDLKNVNRNNHNITKNNLHILPPWCSSSLRQRQAWLMRGRRKIGQQNSNNHIKQTAAIFSPKLRSLSLSPAVLACQEGKTKTISPASLTFLGAGVEAAGGTDGKISKHVLLMRRCSEWSHGHSSAWVATPSGEPTIAAGRTLQCLRLELTLEAKRGNKAVETQRRCAAVCVFLLQPAVHVVHLTSISVTRCAPSEDKHTHAMQCCSGAWRTGYTLNATYKKKEYTVYIYICHNQLLCLSLLPYSTSLPFSTIDCI